MFRDELKRKLTEIFGFKKTTFDQPSNHTDGSFEQDTLFVDVTDVKARMSEGKQNAQVSGNLIVYAQLSRMPYGFFNKKIEEADASSKAQFFFFELDTVPESPARFQNISERRCKFIYLFSAQYDPNQGSLTSVSLGEIS